METGKKHLASLDSLRGIGVILIFANHFNLPNPYILFGWIGLWIFFVLSGYLITEGLLKIRTLPLRQYFARFYLKRAFRILPAFLVFFPIAVALYFTFPHWLAGSSNLGQYWIYIVTFTFNHYPVQVPAAGVCTSVVAVSRRAVLRCMAMVNLLSANEVAKEGRASVDSSGSSAPADYVLSLRRRFTCARCCRSLFVMSGRCLCDRGMRGDISRPTPASVEEITVDHDSSGYCNWSRKLFHRCLCRWIVLANTGLAASLSRRL